ncbi:MAG: hypothetical protein D6768_06115 [Chloroflexi bacterium]|nr:MAG: hypothetical protein D6768_06115 [Chloroflexota bacterium]
MFGYSAFELVNFTLDTAGDQQQTAGDQNLIPPQPAGVQPDGELSLKHSATRNAARTFARFLKSPPLPAA